LLARHCGQIGPVSISGERDSTTAARRLKGAEMKARLMFLGLCVVWPTIAVVSPVQADVKVHRLMTRGSGYERGLQQGKQLRKPIREVLDGRLGTAARKVAQFPETVAHFLRNLRALPNGREFMDEMQGISEGADVAFVDVAALNLCFRARKLDACTTVALPETADGPILASNGDMIAGRRSERRHRTLHVAYPVTGRAMIYYSFPGTVWMVSGINDAGLAISSTSGGPGHRGYNADGLYVSVAKRYALQFFDNTEDVSKFFHSHRQVSKPINVSVLDRSGNAAILEYASYAVGLRTSKDRRPLYATNFFQTKLFKPYSAKIEDGAYLRNARARYRRLEELIGSTRTPDLAFAKSIVRDANNGNVGQICQDNEMMYTYESNLLMCQDASAYFYLGHPTECEPLHVRLDPRKKPKQGKPAPPSEAVSALLETTEGNTAERGDVSREASTKYLDPVLKHLDTMITEGTDRYGSERSPMFCSILDLKTHRLPEKAPPLLPGQRAADRAFPGGNLHHDLLTLLTMYHVSRFSDNDLYATAADAYLDFFLRRCAPVGNGLFPCGEHAFWDFRKEAVGRPTHEELGFVPREFLQELWAVNPQATERHIRALERHVVDRERWYWNRHAAILGQPVKGVRVIARHGGFYIHQWAFLHSKTGDPQLLELARKTAEVHWAQRHPKTGNKPSFLKGEARHGGDHDKAIVVPGDTLTMGLSLLRANKLIGKAALPRFEEIGQAYVDGALRGAGHDPKNGVVVLRVHNDGSQYDPRDYPAHWTGTLGFWESAYGASGGYGFVGAEKFAVMCLCAHRLTGSAAHLQFAKDVWDFYQTQTRPTKKGITPGKFAGLIALSLDLHDLTSEKKYLDFARQCGDWAVKELYANGLFRAHTGADYYEAANGVGGLVLELFRLHLTVTGSDYPLPRNYWDT